jgi:diguanylate cyclase (GGDEF)-like protein
MIVEVVAFSSQLHLPILMEYEELSKLQINAATDPLTGLYNRRFFEDHFERELNRAMRYGQHLTLVMLDLHQFKEVNDRYGHQQGDTLLRTVAITLRKSLRASDYAFRIGGDEFALLLIQSDAGQSTALARRVCAKVDAMVQSMEMSLALGPDYGLAVYPEDGSHKEVLIRVADERLYQMKHSQRNVTALLYPALSRQSEAQTIALRTLEGSLQPAAPGKATRPRNGVEQRKCERVSMAGTSAYAQLADSSQTARVLDFGYGGVALEVNAEEELDPTFEAVIHLPIMQPMRLNLKRLYEVPCANGQKRVGCALLTSQDRTGPVTPPAPDDQDQSSPVLPE